MKLTRSLPAVAAGAALIATVPTISADAGTGIPVAPKHSVVVAKHVTAFSMNGGRLAWRVPDGANGRTRVMVANVHGNKVTGRHQVGVSRAGSTGALGVSPTTVAYGTIEDGVRGLEVIGSGGKTFIGGITDPRIDVSGDRVLYFVRSGSSRLHAQVFNARVGRARPLGITLRRSSEGMPASLSGRHVAYQKLDASVWVLSLRSDRRTQVRPAGGNPSVPRVFVSRSVVSWGFHHQAQYRDFRSMAEPGSIDLDAGGTMVGLTDHGVIMKSDYNGEVKSYWLTPIGSTGGRDFVRTSGGTPVIDASTIAWRDNHNRLRVAPSGQLPS